MVNQEGQFVDARGRFHALMRDRTSGRQLYQHYMRGMDSKFFKPSLGLTPIESFRI
jgi:hypothetical protein